MNFYISLAVILITFGLASAQKNSSCPDKHWGEDCMNVCGNCYITDQVAEGSPVCNPDDGHCTNGCTGGYSGSRCDEAICVQGCGSGDCVAYNYCANCRDISKVSPNCEDIRLRGLLGSLTAFGVISISITLCGLGSIWYKRRKNTSVSL